MNSQYELIRCRTLAPGAWNIDNKNRLKREDMSADYAKSALMPING